MIGAGPGGAQAEGLDAGFAENGLGTGNSGATGFVGADSEAAGTDGAMAGEAAGPGGAGFPMAGGSGGRQRDAERRRQSWLPEDAGLWEGEPPQVPPLISA
jgi:hypothetical protein